MRLHAGPVRLGIGLLILAVIATGTGSSFIPPVRVLAALFGQGSGPDAIIITTLRLPRVLVAMLAGMALAIAGAILQRVARNPMASPSILGITDGAALGVMTFLWLFSDSASKLAVSIHWQPAAAATGALAFAILVALLTRLDPRGIQEPIRMILYGISLAALAKAAVVLMMILGPVHRAAQAMTWLIGSVSAAHWSDVVTLFLGLCAMVPVLILLRLPLRQLVLDPQSAASTGLHLARAQAVLLAVAVLLTALAVSHVGAMGYVGLIAPHIARRLCGQFTPGYLFASAICGAILLVGADMLSRLLAQPLEIPAGAVTAAIGTPLFLYLLMKGRGAHV
ncbi:FecCD family ABC transporter permease [Paracoccus methylarcula]|uniref:Iron ABC transporter permease n=1 Tax=Paracoccus methylarcula TaxID=72022 RepID=A0A3R7NYC9_9RHOB|nr:iron ABC transporter permease [Paracoccus methylarcula]RNF35275.1 iron ABC transporter permease [Paracoccus methylarcula]